MRERYRFALPTQRDLRPVDPVMTSLSIGFKNERFLWDQIAPPAPADQKSGTYFIYTRDFWFRRLEGAERGPTAPYTRVGYGVATATYNTFEIGFEKALGDTIQAASLTPEDISTMDTQFLTNLIQIELDVRVAASHFITGVWGTSTALLAAGSPFQWSDFAQSDPIADADTAKRVIRRNTGATPNVLFVGLLAWEKLKEHPLITEKYKHTQLGIMTEELVAAALGIDRLVIGDSVQNTGDENQAYSGQDIWTDNALFLVQNQPSLGVANGGYTFMWNERGNVPWALESYRDEIVRSNIQRVFTHIDPQIVSSQHGYMYTDAVA